MLKLLWVRTYVASAEKCLGRASSQDMLPMLMASVLVETSLDQLLTHGGHQNAVVKKGILGSCLQKDCWEMKLLDRPNMCAIRKVSGPDRCWQHQFGFRVCAFAAMMLAQAAQTASS